MIWLFDLGSRPAVLAAQQDSQHGRSQGLLLVQPLRLPQFEDFAVVESVDFVLEELQGRRLAGQRPGDLLPHHLHHLERRRAQLRSPKEVFQMGKTQR